LEAAALLAASPTLRHVEVADALDELAKRVLVPSGNRERDRIMELMSESDKRVNRWLADELRRRAALIADAQSLADLPDWPSREHNFYV
jgi:hypothetical protein